MSALTSGTGTLLDAALDYAARGWPVFPVWGAREDGGCYCPEGLDCPDAAKHPIYSGGFERATTDAEVLAAYWTRYPKANIGMPTGRRSGVLVVDVDMKHGGFETLAALIHKYGEWPRTTAVRTGGGGMHFFFEYPQGGVEIRNSAGKLGPGLDVRGEGGYVLLPPSVHATRRCYEWEDIRDD